MRRVARATVRPIVSRPEPEPSEASMCAFIGRDAKSARARGQSGVLPTRIGGAKVAPATASFVALRWRGRSRGRVCEKLWETPVVDPRSTREVKVHAVVVRVTISDREAAQQRLDQDVVPQVSQAPGFQAGYWTWKDNTGLSMIVLDSEDAANQAAERAREMVGRIDAVSLDGVEVREVVAHA